MPKNKLITGGGEQLSPEYIYKCRNSINNSIIASHSESNKNFNIDFFGMRFSEVDSERDELIKNNDQNQLLILLTSLEGILFIDSNIRVKNSYNDTLSKKLSKKYFTKESRNSYIKLQSDIIDIRKDVDKSELSDSYLKIKEAFSYRNWLAHGRYWELKTGRFDFDDIYICFNFIRTNTSFDFKIL